jgi:hypothetical protein
MTSSSSEIQHHSDEANDDDDDDDQHTHAEAAGGVVRGAARSLGRSVLKAPVGSLPHRAVFRQRLPLRQVAKLSDRLSTGYDWWSTAVESTTDGKKNQVWPLVKNFSTTLVKNTLMGAAVFESYGYIVGELAPAGKVEEAADEDDDEGFLKEPDAFERASLPIHLGAGFAAGSFHGILTTVLESSTVPMYRNILHHASAHSILFGSYEFLKRMLVEEMHYIESGTQIYGGGYLTAFGVAGGIAGQLQHISSHYLELWLGISNAMVVKGDTGALARMRATAPAIRPTLGAFLPSCIGFIAFEYGKKFSS